MIYACSLFFVLGGGGFLGPLLNAPNNYSSSRRTGFPSLFSRYGVCWPTAGATLVAFANVSLRCQAHMFPFSVLRFSDANKVRTCD